MRESFTWTMKPMKAAPVSLTMMGEEAATVVLSSWGGESGGAEEEGVQGGDEREDSEGGVLYLYAVVSGRVLLWLGAGVARSQTRALVGRMEISLTMYTYYYVHCTGWLSSQSACQ